MEKINSKQWYRLKSEFEVYANHIVTGKIATSATNMWTLSHDIMKHLAEWVFLLENFVAGPHKISINFLNKFLLS